MINVDIIKWVWITEIDICVCCFDVGTIYIYDFVIFVTVKTVWIFCSWWNCVIVWTLI